MKNKEIPSIPNGKLIDKIGIQRNFSVNWKVPMDLSKNTHINRDEIKVKQEKFKTIDFKTGLFWNGVTNNKKLPNKGKSKVKESKFCTNNI